MKRRGIFRDAQLFAVAVHACLLMLWQNEPQRMLRVAFMAKERIPESGRFIPGV